MPYFTAAELQAYAQSPERLEKARRAQTARASARTTIFLSHSHHDRDLVQGAINLLANQGVLVYVDWLDPGMPEVTSAETAARIKQFIALNRRFVLLATDASLASRWVPWELGCADGIKGPPHMGVLPVMRPPHTFNGSEYLNLYSRIMIADDGRIGVFQPGQTQGITLQQWLEG